MCNHDEFSHCTSLLPFHKDNIQRPSTKINVKTLDVDLLYHTDVMSSSYYGYIISLNSLSHQDYRSHPWDKSFSNSRGERCGVKDRMLFWVRIGQGKDVNKGENPRIISSFAVLSVEELFVQLYWPCTRGIQCVKQIFLLYSFAIS